MTNSIIRFATFNDLEELLNVYKIVFPNTMLTLDKLKNYLYHIPNSILIGLVDNKIVSHMFMHPITNLDYNNFSSWSSYESFNPNGEYLLIWGVGILKQYRTLYNFAWSMQNKLLQTSLTKYKNIKYSVIYVSAKTKFVARWNLNFGYMVDNILNDVGPNHDHLYILKMPIKTHIEQHGYNKLKSHYGYTSEGTIPIFMEG